MCPESQKHRGHAKCNGIRQSKILFQNLKYCLGINKILCTFIISSCNLDGKWIKNEKEPKIYSK